MVIAVIVAGCAPSGGGAARDTDPESPPGSGRASMSWDVSGQRHRSPSQSDIDSARTGPMPPAGGE